MENGIYKEKNGLFYLKYRNNKYYFYVYTGSFKHCLFINRNRVELDRSFDKFLLFERFHNNPSFIGDICFFIDFNIIFLKKINELLKNDIKELIEKI